MVETNMYCLEAIHVLLYHNAYNGDVKLAISVAQIAMKMYYVLFHVFLFCWGRLENFCHPEVILWLDEIML